MTSTWKLGSPRAIAGVFAILGAGLGAGCDRSPPPAPEQVPPGTGTAVSAVAGQVAGQGAGQVAGTVRASGSSALQPLVNAAKERFEASHAGVHVEASAGGSTKGIADVASGAVDIGDSDIPAPPDLRGQLVDHKVAVVGFAAMANKGAFDDAVTALSKEDLARVFTGAVTNWKDLGGKPQPIVVINRAPGSGTRAVFGKAVLGGDTFVESQTEDNSGALVAKLKQTKGAISYLALSFQDPELLTIALKADGGAVAPTEATITTGAYPIFAYEHMLTKGEATGATKAFLDYVLSPELQEHMGVKGFIPVTHMKVQRDDG